MSNEVLFYTQIGSALMFVVVLFTLYRSLAEQKDARIALLEEKAKFLQAQLDVARLSGPDVLARSLSERVSILEAELQRRRADSSTDQARINETTHELAAVRRQVTEFQRQLAIADDLVGQLLCPHCGAPIQERTTDCATITTDNGDYDVDWTDTYYECGLHIHDGKEVSACQRVAG
jgi:hypothetical protein